MYINFVEALVFFYQQKKQNQDLPLCFTDPTPARLRDECIEVYKARWNNRDTEIIAKFFGADWKDYLETEVKQIKIERFKPLVSFLKDQKITPAYKTVALLAWLIDFPPRPFSHTFDYVEYKEKLLKAQVAQSPDLMEHFGDPTSSPLEPKISAKGNDDERSGKSHAAIKLEFPKKTGLQKMIAVTIILIGAGMWGYFNRSNASSFTTGCMIWSNDHYVALSCDSGIGDETITKLNGDMLNNFRRITRPDTITEKHIGKLWYQKRGPDSLDYFTGGGQDPVKPNRDLHRLTKYIYDKYLRKDKP